MKKDKQGCLYLRLFAILCWVLGSLTLYAQSAAVQMEYLSLNDGLSDRSVTDIIQAKDGLIWIATENGLNKFDGYDFTVFNDGRTSAIRLSENNIKQLAESRQQDIIILYTNNVSFFDIVNPLDYSCRKVDLLPEYGLKGIVRSIHVDNSGEVFVLTVEKKTINIYQYLKDNEFSRILQVEEKNELKGSANVNFIHLQDGSFLINTPTAGLRQFYPGEGLLKTYRSSEFTSGTAASRGVTSSVAFMHEDRYQRVWLSYFNQAGVYRIDPADFSVDTVPGLAQQHRYQQIWEDEIGNVLLTQTEGIGYQSSIEGLHGLTPQDTYFNLSHLANAANSIATVFSRNFFGYLFLGTKTGLKIVSNNRTKVETFLAENLSPDRRGVVIGGITGDGEEYVYFNRASRDWYRVDIHTGIVDTLSRIDHESGETQEFTCGIDLQYAVNDDKLWGIACYRSTQGQLHRYDLETCTTVSYFYPHRFSAFTFDQQGLLWLTTTPIEDKGALVAFDPVSEQFTTFKDPEDRNPLKNTTPRCILESKDGTLWIGTENGLFHIDTETAEVARYSNEATKGFAGLSHNTVYVIHEDERGVLWLGTKNGLNIFDPANGQVRIYDQSTGLASSAVYGIVPDESGSFWISTANGLSYFDPQNEDFRNFYQADGLSSDEFSPFSAYRDYQGRYYFGGSNGLNTFYAEDLLINKNIPSPILTKLEIFDNAKDSIILRDTNLHQLNRLIINPSNGYFSLHFALPIYHRSRKNQFKFKLVGLDGSEKNWKYLKNNPVLRYNHLAPGEYTLYMLGADPNGNWSETPFVLSIKVKQHFYKTGWFYLVLVVIAVAIGYGIFKYQLEQRLRVERLRMKLSSDLHDEVSGLLSGIAMQTDLLQMTAAQDDNRERLKSIGEVSRKAMSKMSDVIWSIDSRKDRLEDLIDRMQEHADEVLLPLGIRYDFNVGKLEKNQKIPVSVRQDLYFIFKEAVNNVSKHSKASHVKVTLRNNGNTFEMTIKDNGVGRLSREGALTSDQQNGKRFNTKSGQGLSNLRMRAGRLHAHLDIVENGGYAIRLRMKKFA